MREIGSASGEPSPESGAALVDRIRQGFPTPVAGPFARAMVTRSAEKELADLLQATEALLHLVGAVVLVDASHAADRPEALASLGRALDQTQLREATVGAWAHVITSVAPHVRQPFLVELAELTADTWRWKRLVEAIGTLRTEGNSVAHPRRDVTGSALPRLQRVRPAFERVCEELAFLSRYLLLVVESCDEGDSGRYRAVYRPLRGAIRNPDWRNLPVTFDLNIGDVLLVRPGSPSECLLLDPFYRVQGRFEELPASLFAFHRVRDGRAAYYGVADPDAEHVAEPDGLPLNPLERIRRRGRRPARRVLALSREDVERLGIAPPTPVAVQPTTEPRAAVEERGDTAGSAGDTSTEESRVGRRSFLSRGGLLAGAALLATLLAAGTVYVAGSPSSAARAAERAYRDAIDAANAGNEAAYLAAFEDPIDCFYDAAGLEVEALRARRSKVVADKASRYVIESIQFARDAETTVEFWETGHIERPGRRFPHRKAIRMQWVAGQWRIGAEAEASHHRCWPELE